jgi:hypothetical protein
MIRAVNGCFLLRQAFEEGPLFRHADGTGRCSGANGENPIAP